MFFIDALEQFDILHIASQAYVTCTLWPTNLSFTHFLSILVLLGLVAHACYDSGIPASLFGAHSFYSARVAVQTFDNLHEVVATSVATDVQLYWWDALFTCRIIALAKRSSWPEQMFFMRSKTTSSLLFCILLALFNLVADILRDNVLQQKNMNIGFIFFLFLNILLLNVMGLFPFTFTVTSSFVVTLFFSLTVFLAANIMGLFFNGLYLFSSFLPTGTPLFIAPLLILIEVVSYFSRIFSLSIRLFANMLSGHGLLKILIWFAFVTFRLGTGWAAFGALPWLVVTIVFALEAAIAFLQAYVFIILTANYINDAIRPH
jgi:ATP synthase subunit 6